MRIINSFPMDRDLGQGDIPYEACLMELCVFHLIKNTRGDTLALLDRPWWGMASTPATIIENIKATVIMNDHTQHVQSKHVETQNLVRQIPFKYYPGNDWVTPKEEYRNFFIDYRTLLANVDIDNNMLTITAVVYYPKALVLQEYNIIFNPHSCTILAETDRIFYDIYLTPIFNTKPNLILRD